MVSPGAGVVTQLKRRIVYSERDARDDFVRCA